MSTWSTSRPVYVSFDRVPAPKGAAVHIAAFAQALGREFGPIDLVTVSPGADPPPAHERWPGVHHHQLPARGDNVIVRALDFRRRLGAFWQGRRAPLVHFRSIYEGYPLASRKGRLCQKLVFEVNGLPSIELKHHYPEAGEDADLMRKLRVQEDRCIAAADLLITPSAVTAEYLLSRGAPTGRVRVIPNGADVSLFSYQAPRSWDRRAAQLLYSGTLSAWQGVGVAIEALGLYRQQHPATLLLVGPASERRRRELLDRCQDLGLSGQVQVREPVDGPALLQLHHDSDAVLAPLLPDDRNVVQGCCPLKVLEAMASGTPLVASDLPVVAQLARHDEHALLCKPGSARAIADALLRLRADPALGPRLSASARRRIEDRYLWTHAQDALLQAYEDLGLARSSTSRRASASAAW